MKASNLLVKCLEEEGIEYIFGVPGEENADFMMSLEESTKIKFILTRHEQGAAFMADIYGRLTGNPAGALGTLGPGATNLITGVADSNMDRAPMLVLTGQGSTDRLHKESHQIMDVVSMFKSVTKWATTIRHPDTIPEIVRKAVRLARTEKPGAVHIELPEDIAAMDTSATPLVPRRFRRAVPDDKIVDQAFAMLKKAKRPVIIAGNGCIRRRASKQLRLLCEKTGIGVISTFMAKGCVDMDADYCLYTVGLGTKDRVNAAIDDADLVITLGFDMVEYHPQLWNSNKDNCILHADFLPAEIDEHYDPETELIGDLAHTLWMLNKRLDEHGPLAFELEQQRRIRADMADDFAEHKDDLTEMQDIHTVLNEREAERLSSCGFVINMVCKQHGNQGCTHSSCKLPFHSACPTHMTYKLRQVDFPALEEGEYYREVWFTGRVLTEGQDAGKIADNIEEALTKFQAVVAKANGWKETRKLIMARSVSLRLERPVTTVTYRVMVKEEHVGQADTTLGKISKA
ncbi:MAG: hypothetical protein IIC12_04430, partial [Proteobacteria bacterium]|nr:hypothetical protein [Pseudomonadota bacterium]